jgi:hypothetical protein
VKAPQIFKAHSMGLLRRVMLLFGRVIQ